MKITISSNGDVRIGDLGKSKKLGNLLVAVPDKIQSGSGLHLELELPNFHCNIGGENPTQGQFACLMCPRSRSDFVAEMDRIDQICDLLANYVGQIDQLHIAGLAEPFWKDRIGDVIGRLHIENHPAIKVGTTTNALLLDSAACDRWFSSVQRSEVRFSIDAGTPDTYLKIRRIPEFELAVGNMNRFCRKRDSDRHTAILSNNINLLNLSELHQMVEMAKNNFCHYLSLVPTSPTDPSLLNICLNRDNQQQFMEAAQSTREFAGQIGVEVVFGNTWPR